MSSATGSPEDPFERLRRIGEQVGAFNKQAAIARQAMKAFDATAVKRMQEAAQEAMRPMQDTVRAIEAINRFSVPDLAIPEIARNDALIAWFEEISERHRSIFNALPENFLQSVRLAADDLGVDEDVDSFDRHLGELVGDAAADRPGALDALTDFLKRYRSLLFWVFQLMVTGIVFSAHASAADPQVVALIDQVALVTEMLIVAAQPPRSGGSG